MQARDLIGNREAKAAAAAGSIGYPIEALAHRLSLIGWDPRTVVLDLEVSTVADRSTAHGHVSTRRDIANGVVDEIREHLANQPRHTVDAHGLDLRSEIDALSSARSRFCATTSSMSLPQSSEVNSPARCTAGSARARVNS